jgi:hypothetical protein
MAFKHGESGVVPEAEEMSMSHSALFAQSTNSGATGAAGTVLAPADAVAFAPDSLGMQILARRLRLDEYLSNKEEDENPTDYINRMAAINAPVISAYCAWTSTVKRKVDWFNKEKRTEGW